MIKIDAIELKNYIIKEDKYIDILTNVGCHSFRENIKEIRCALPEHNNNTGVCVKKDNAQSIVYSGGANSKGDIYTLIMFIKKISFFEAFKYCCNVLNIQIDVKKEKKKSNVLSIFKTSYRERKYTNDLQIYDLNKTNYIFLPHIDLIKEDISIKSQIDFHIGYDTKTRRILFPHFKWDGNDTDCVGIIGRSTNPNCELLGIPKYYPLIPYKKSLNLYGLQHNYAYIQKSGYVVVYESEKSVLKRASLYDYTGVSVGCHDISTEQIRILISLNVEVIIAFDKDVSEEEIKKQCKKFHKNSIVSYIIDKDNLLDEKDSPCDKGDNIYCKLFSKRILYREE